MMIPEMADLHRDNEELCDYGAFMQRGQEFICHIRKCTRHKSLIEQILRREERARTRRVSAMEEKDTDTLLCCNEKETIWGLITSVINYPKVRL